MKIVIDFFRNNETKEKYQKLLRELVEYESKSIRLRLNGKHSSPHRIANACLLMEEGCYMRDYIGNEKGAIVEVRFDQILG